MAKQHQHYDVLIVGSGFGGSVTALRLAEKGYSVAVLEAGRRFADHEFATSTWDLRRYLFAPAIGCLGIQRITRLDHATIVSGAGVGGGSLVYGNTLYEAPDSFYEDPRWAHITDWRAELSTCFDQAARMLGVRTYDRITAADEVMKKIAVDLGIPERWTPTPVAVVLGDQPGLEVPDPYFGGVGPTRHTCLHCGECMSGCRHNAKNSTTKNYLHLAETAGVKIHPRRTVTDLVERPRGGYEVRARTTGFGPRSSRHRYTADHVVLAAGALGTQTLLHTLRDRGRLPHLSDTLGNLTRTNSEAGVTIRSRNADRDFTTGAAITCSLHLDDRTHAEPTRYGRGSGIMALGMTVMTDPEPGTSRLHLTFREMLRNARELPRMLNPRGWSEQTLIIGVMQNVDNSLTTASRPRRFGLGLSRLHTRPGTGDLPPAHLPDANRLGRLAAGLIDGIPSAGWNDALDQPLSGHFLGGCAIATSADDGVVDPYHRVHGHPSLHVIDGSTITVNLGVNPSMTIVALAERATALWPNKGETDSRPAPGEPYRPTSPVAPRAPVVPDDAPAAYRISRSRQQPA